MAQFTAYNPGPFWGDSLGDLRTNSAELLYVNDTSVGYLAADGTYIYLTGTGFTYTTDANGVPRLSGGTFTKVSHFDSAGQQISTTTGIANAVADVTMVTNAYAGNDVLDARVRANNAVVNDTLNGFAGNDRLFGGTGNDKLFGGSGDDRLFGDNGADRLEGGSGNDVIVGGHGNDLLAGSQGNDTLQGGIGTDTAFFLGKFSELTITRTGAGFVVQSAESGTDTLSSIERIATNDGVYTFNTASGTWTKDSEAVQSLMLADPGLVFNGTSGSDSLPNLPPIRATLSYDLMFGGGGDDTFNFNISVGGSVQHDHGLLYGYGGEGNDTFSVQFPTSYLYSPARGNFHFFGENGDDTLEGGLSSDELDGGNGNDILNGSNGNDLLTGGTGADSFIFNGGGFPQPRYTQVASGNDIITDFEVGTDKLGFGGYTVFSIEDTTDGLLVNMSGASGMFATGSVLLQGVHGAYTLDDLILA